MLIPVLRKSKGQSNLAPWLFLFHPSTTIDISTQFFVIDFREKKEIAINSDFVFRIMRFKIV